MTSKNTRLPSPCKTPPESYANRLARQTPTHDQTNTDATLPHDVPAGAALTTLDQIDNMPLPYGRGSWPAHEGAVFTARHVTLDLFCYRAGQMDTLRGLFIYDEDTNTHGFPTISPSPQGPARIAQDIFTRPTRFSTSPAVRNALGQIVHVCGGRDEVGAGASIVGTQGGAVGSGLDALRAARDYLNRQGYATNLAPAPDVGTFRQVYGDYAYPVGIPPHARRAFLDRYEGQEDSRVPPVTYWRYTTSCWIEVDDGHDTPSLDTGEDGAAHENDSFLSGDETGLTALHNLHEACPIGPTHEIMAAVALEISKGEYPDTGVPPDIKYTSDRLREVLGEAGIHEHSLTAHLMGRMYHVFTHGLGAKPKHFPDWDVWLPDLAARMIWLREPQRRV